MRTKLDPRLRGGDDIVRRDRTRSRVLVEDVTVSVTRRPRPRATVGSPVVTPSSFPAALRFSSLVLSHALRAAIGATAAMLVYALGAVPNASAQTATGRVHGVTTDRSSGHPISATVTLTPGTRATRSDSLGRFAFVDVPAGDLTLTATALGHVAERIIVRVTAEADVEALISMRTVTRVLDAMRTTAVVSPERAQLAAPAGASITSIGAHDLTMIPAVGEADVLRAASLLPGIAARNDFWAGFNVRGGESDQTQVRLDGLSVFSPFHLGGLFSTFIPSAVREVDARVGALPASYGGRLSGTLDVESQEETRDGVHGSVDVSLISAAVRVGGRLPTPRGSWNVAVRRTYVDAFADVIKGRDAFPYHFQDAEAHATVGTRGGGTLAFTGYLGSDLLNPTGTDTTSAVTGGTTGAFRFDWGNRLAGVVFTQPLGTTASFVQRVAYSAYHTGYHDDTTGVHLTNTIGEFRLSGEVSRRFGDATKTLHTLRAGYELSGLRTRYDERISATGADDFGSVALVIDDTIVRQTSSARAVFAEELWTPGTRFSIRAGARAEQVPLASWTGVSPRVAVKFRARGNLAFSLATGRYSQWVHAVRNEDLPVRIVDIWFASDSNVAVSTGTEVVGGSELWLSSTDMIRVEGYVKKFADLVEPASTIDPRLRPTDLRRFGGTSKGVEILVRRMTSERINGWIAYSYGRSIRERDGEQYYPAHDRRHDLNIVANYRPGSRYTFGARFGVASGTPYTGFAGSYARWSYDPITRRWRPPAGNSSARNEQARTARNGERYPTYHRLDLSAQRPYRVRGHDVEVFANLVNALNHRNVLLYTFDSETSPPALRGFSQLPLLPTFGMRVPF